MTSDVVSSRKSEKKVGRESSPEQAAAAAMVAQAREQGLELTDVFFLVCDGLKGMPEVVANVWPRTVVQTCIIHLIRNSFRLVSRKYWDPLKKDLKPIYTAPNPDAAAIALDELEDKWGTQYPAIIRLWRHAWDEFIPFLDIPRRNLQQALRRGDPTGVVLD